MRKILLYLIVCLFGDFSSHALLIKSGNFKIDRFSNNEGLNQNTIIDIAQDKYGFLWFATPNGLVKYDYYDFTLFTHNNQNSNSVNSNTIHSLYSDENGAIWIGTGQGVDVFLPELEEFIHVPLDSGISIKHIASDAFGNVWISSHQAMFTCKLIRTDSTNHFVVGKNILPKSFNTYALRRFFFLDENTCLFALSSGVAEIQLEGLDKNEPRITKTIQRDKSLNTIVFYDIEPIGSDLWVGTLNGVFKLKNKTTEESYVEVLESIVNQPAVIPDVTVTEIKQDRNNTLWICTKHDGIYRGQPGDNTFKHLAYNPKNKDGISSAYIKCMFQDRYGVIWFGTAQGGINKLNEERKPFINYQNNPFDNHSIGGDLITDIIVDSRGVVWLASYNNSLSRSVSRVDSATIDKLLFEQVDINLKKHGDFIVCMYEDSKGCLWFGTKRGGYFYNPSSNAFKEISFVNDNHKTRLTHCRFITEQSGNIIFGGSTLVVVKNPWQQIGSNNSADLEIKSMVTEDVRHIQSWAKTSNDNYWLGSSKGLFHFVFKNDSLIKQTHLTTDPSCGTDIALNNKNIFSLHYDESGFLWVGTFGGGLHKLVLDSLQKVVSIERYTKNDLLPDDAVYGILQENDTALWVSTDMGLCRINTKRLTSHVFDLRDGLPNNNFRQSAYYKSENGYFFFGGLNGLSIFRPDDIKLNQVQPKGFISKIEINNQVVSIGEEVDGKVLIDKSPIETKGIAISHQTKVLTLHVMVQHSDIPSKNTMAYMLSGFDADWVDIEAGKSEVTYTNLEPGDYVFRLKSANCDGVWTDQIVRLNIKVLPPWYNTWWSYAMVVLIILLIMSLVFSFLIKQSKLTQRLAFEQMDKERIEQINKGKLQFFTNISHEFRTPLTLIEGPLESLFDERNFANAKKHLRAIKNNTTRLLSLINQLVTFRSAEQGFLNLNLSKNTFGEFILPAAEAFEGFALKKNIKYDFKVDLPDFEVVLDIEKVERIIFNLLSNSFKHTPADGTVSFYASIENPNDNSIIKFQIIDSGKGIPKEKLDKIFERFYQVETRDENVGGTGIGLAICKSLIELMRGAISVESSPGIKTCFTVTIPCHADMESESPIEKAKDGKQSLIKEWIPDQDIVSTIKGIENLRSEPVDTILIVEDEDSIRNYLADVFGSKYKVLTAENGVEGVESIKENHPGLVLCDVMMPDMDGFEMCEIVKSSDALCHIPIILLTALGDTENKIKGLEFGADDYIDKPFSIRHLHVKVEKLLESKRKLKAYYAKNYGVPENNQGLSVKDAAFLEKLDSEIEKQLSNSDFGVEELASNFGTSSTYLYRKLKQITGQVPSTYLRNYRLQRAAELLRSNQGYNTIEVMYMIGIESNSYFSTMFKKLHGVSPSKFLKDTTN